MDDSQDKIAKKFNPLPPPPTQEQKKIFERFKSEISAILTPEELAQLDDAALYRFLRARKYQIKESTKMLVNFIKWRKEFGTIDISDPKINLVSKWGVYYILPHTDRFGRPIVVFNARRYNPTKRDLEGTVKLFVYELEHIISMMKPGVERMLVILDLQGYKRKHNDLACARVCLGIFQDYYPERLGAAIVVNHSWIFWAFWTLIKPFLDKNTRQKVHFLEQREITETLSKIIELDLLPEQFGGKFKLPQPAIDAWASEDNNEEPEEHLSESNHSNNAIVETVATVAPDKEESENEDQQADLTNQSNSNPANPSQPHNEVTTVTPPNQHDDLPEVKAKI
jgi:hypothetical protein